MNNGDRNSSIHALLYGIMFSVLTMLEARIAYSHKSTYIYIHNKLNIVSYNSACIELLRSPLVSLYIHNLCASRREELAHVQRSWAVLNGNTTSKTYVVLLVVTALTSSVARLETYLFNCAFD